MVTFNFSYAPGTTLQQMIGFEMAGQVWSSYLADPVSVNIYVGVSSSLPGTAIGGALPGIRASQNYKEVVRGLEADATSGDDFTTLPHLRDKSDYEAWFDAFDLKNGKNSGEKIKTRSMNITRANAKALGINTGGSNDDLDGVILFGNLDNTLFDWSYDFTRSASAVSYTLDFLSTAMHEIAHVLGFVSGVDKPGWLNSLAADKAGLEEYKKSLTERAAYTTPMDLFRYSTAAEKGRNDLSYGSVGATKFFSIDGGETAIAEFSTGADRNLGGDGFQASHWKNSSTRTGIMAPAISPEERAWISTTDLRAFDVMGWDRKFGVTINLATLRTQAEQTLAQRLGVSTTWLSQNAGAAAQQLGVDRFADVDRMIRASEIYPWTSKPTGGSTSPTPWRQVLDLFEQQVVYSNFESLDPQDVIPSGKLSIDLKALAPRPTVETVKRMEVDFRAIASPTVAISEFTPVEFANLQSWFDQLSDRKDRQCLDPVKPDALNWAIVDWTNC